MLSPTRSPAAQGLGSGRCGFPVWSRPAVVTAARGSPCCGPCCTAGPGPEDVTRPGRVWPAAPTESDSTGYARLQGCSGCLRCSPDDRGASRSPPPGRPSVWGTQARVQTGPCAVCLKIRRYQSSQHGVKGPTSRTHLTDVPHKDPEGWASPWARGTQASAPGLVPFSPPDHQAPPRGLSHTHVRTPPRVSAPRPAPGLGRAHPQHSGPPESQSGKRPLQPRGRCHLPAPRSLTSKCFQVPWEEVAGGGPRWGSPSAWPGADPEDQA